MKSIKRSHLVLIAIWLSSNLLDIYVTQLGFRLKQMEINPLPRWLMSHYGETGLYGWKLTITLGVLVTVLVLSKRYRRIWLALYLGNVLTLGVMLIGVSRLLPALEQAGSKPEAAEAHRSLGIHYLMLNNLDLARQEFLTAIALEPDSAEAHYGLALAYYHQGQPDEAVEEAWEVIRLNPRHAGGPRILAFVYHDQGQLESALSEAQKALHLNPNSIRTHYILGLCYRDMGDIAKAIEMFEKCVKLKADWHLDEGYQAKAREELEKLGNRGGKPLSLGSLQPDGRLIIEGKRGKNEGKPVDRS